MLRELGADRESIGRAAGLRSEILADPENLIPFQALDRLLHECVAQTCCEHFGLLVGQRSSASSWGLIGLLAEHSPDIRTALENLVRHFHIHDSRGVPILELGERTVSLGYTIFESSSPGCLDIIDWTVATEFKIMRHLWSNAWQPIEVMLPRRTPQDTKPFDSFFEVPVRFGAEHGAVICSSDGLTHPVPDANPLIRDLVERRIAELDSEKVEDFETQLRRLLRSLVLVDECSCENVAAMLDIERRTLHRRLQREGITFRQVTDEVRYEAARHLLTDTSLTMAEIAAKLDYSEATAFARAFRRWSGIAPMNWRAEHAARPRWRSRGSNDQDGHHHG
jgi:AraC-like DNA-binding protein